MDLDDLNLKVTREILCAEASPPGSLQHAAAFHKVSELEESIAEITAADTVEGEIARVGAVTAAISAGEPARAVQVADRYLGEGIGDRVRARLLELRAQAEAMREAANSKNSAIC